MAGETSHILTERLLLRPQQPEDFDGWADFQADPVQTKFVGGVQDRASAWRSFCTMAGAWTIRGYAMFSMIERSTGQWIGRTGPWYPEGWPAQEIGWGVLSSHAGKGYATEAAAASMDFVFDVLGWDRVIHCIDPDNVNSQKVAERLGSRNLGPTRMPAPYQDLPVDAWGQSRDEWRAQRERVMGSR